MRFDFSLNSRTVQFKFNVITIWNYFKCNSNLVYIQFEFNSTIIQNYSEDNFNWMQIEFKLWLSSIQFQFKLSSNPI